LKIDGNDVMKILKIKPGPKVGEILNKLFKQVEEGKLKTKEGIDEESKRDLTSRHFLKRNNSMCFCGVYECRFVIPKTE